MSMAAPRFAPALGLFCGVVACSIADARTVSCTTPHPCDAWALYCAPLPAHATAHFDVARALAVDGSYDLAISEYAALLSEEPMNADYWFGIGQALAWSGQAANAIEVLQCARRLAPEYEDVWLLELNVRRAQAAEGKKASYGEFLREIQQAFPDAEWLQSEDHTNQPHYRWELGADYETVNANDENWQVTYAKVGIRYAESGWLYAGISGLSRFGREDRLVEVSLDAPISAVWSITASLAAGPSAAFVPELRKGIGLRRTFGSGWITGVQFDGYEYANGDVRRTGISVERYTGNLRLGYQGFLSALDGEDGITHTASVSYYRGDNSGYSIIGSTGNEIESVAPGQLLRTRVNALVLTGHHALTASLGISWRIGIHRQGDLYDRRLIGVSVDGEY